MIIGGVVGLIVAGSLGWWGGATVNRNPNEEMRGAGNNARNTELSVSDNSAIEAVDYVSVRPGVVSLPSEAISAAEQDGLIIMREEEKMARDVYTTLFEKWNLQTFYNIAQSEQTHTEAVQTLLSKYNIADPVTNDAVGIFTNPDFQKLYTDLTTKGLTSVEAALTVGATIEDLDISDLKTHLSVTDNQDIKLVYENLMRGSRNHLRAFTSQLTSRGESYTPQYLTKEEFEAIITSAKETGNGSGAGNGGGNGAGSGNGGGSMGTHAGRGWGGR